MAEHVPLGQGCGLLWQGKLRFLRGCSSYQAYRSVKCLDTKGEAFLHVRTFTWREHVAPSLILPRGGGVAQLGRRGS